MPGFRGKRGGRGFRAGLTLLAALFMVPGLAGAPARGAPAAPPPDMFGYQDAPRMSGADIPNLELRDPARAQFLAFQYGAAGTDVVYFAFDYSSRKKTPDILLVYVPGDCVYGRPVPVRGRLRADGAVEFRPVRLEGRFGGFAVSYRVQLAATEKRAQASIQCALVAVGKKFCGFDLAGRFDRVANRTLPIEPIRILTKPGASVRLDQRRKPAELVGYVRIGRFRLMPRSGMDTRLQVFVRDGAGKRIALELALLDRKEEGRFHFKPTRPLLPGQTYTAETVADLGPVFGVLKHKINISPRIVKG